MNIELKNLLTVIFSIVKIGEDASGGAGMVAEISDTVKLAEVIPSLITNWSDLKNEIEALPGSAQEQDLLTFIQTEVATVNTNEQAQAVVAAITKVVGDLAQDGIAVYNAIKAI